MQENEIPEDEGQVPEDAAFLEMSDDEISNMSGPENLVSEKEEIEGGSGEDDHSTTGDDALGSAAGAAAGDSGEVPGGSVDATAANPEREPDGDGDKPADAAPEPEAVNYEEAYKEIMAPFKANGKTFTPKNLAEVKQLAQLGANYTKKMQALQPNLKAVKMLQNAGLLDENKLNDIIDLHTKKDPAAIAKFLKDSNVDPMDVDVSEDTQYKPTNHRVSDAEMKFQEALEDVASSQIGKETIRVIDKEWDRESKGRVYSNPEILSTIRDQRENGVYSQITSEIERLRVLGDIDANTPFLDAYKAVGDQLHNHGLLKINGVPTNQMGKAPGQGAPQNQAPTNARPSTQTAPRVIERRSEKPKPAVTNNAGARAAMGNRSANVSKKTNLSGFDVLAMSDEEFEKAANMR